MKNLEEKYKNNQLSLDELLELRDKVNSMNDEILEETMCESWMNDDIDISNISSERMNRIKKEVDRTIGKKTFGSFFDYENDTNCGSNFITSIYNTFFLSI